MYRASKSGRFFAYVGKGGRRHNLGSWPTARLAAVARDRAAMFLGIDEWPLNVPEESRRLGPCAPSDLARAALLRTKRFIGVSFHAKPRTWAAHVELGGIKCLVTGFHEEEDAAVARDRMALWLGLGRERLNFPERRLEPASNAEIRRELGRTARGKPTSGYLGVWVERNAKICAGVSVQGKRYLLTGFDSQREAAKARDRLALGLLGRGAELNFPNGRLRPASFEKLKREREAARKRRMSSRYRGVSLASASPRSKIPWLAFLPRPGGEKLWLLGRWASERAAALAHDRAVLHYQRGQQLNFPKEARKLGPANARALRAQARREFKELTSSRYVGVNAQPNGSWFARVSWQKRSHYLGTFDSEEDAARAYDRAASRLMGDKARLNFQNP